MKYIDAEKLKAVIRIIQQILEHRDVRSNQVKKIRTECMMEFCKCIFDVIDSLQQEQSEVELGKLGEIARHIIAVKQNVEDMRLSEDEWSLLERIGYPQQEQQEVDLEEEIDLWISENENIHHGDKLMVWLLKDVAHHFYGLSKNSK